MMIYYMEVLISVLGDRSVFTVYLEQISYTFDVEEDCHNKYLLTIRRDCRWTNVCILNVPV